MESPLYPRPPARASSPRTDSRQSNSPSPSTPPRGYSPRPPSAALSPRLNLSAGVPANASLAATYGITESFPSLAASAGNSMNSAGVSGTQHFIVARPSTSNPYSYRALPVNWDVFNYSLANATTPQVISALKSDIFRAHSRLEKLQREYNRSLGRERSSSPSRPDTARSRLRSELDAIKKGTADVDEIVAEYEGSGRSLELRLKLLELLSARLVGLEMQGLQMTEKNALPTSSIVNLSQTFLATQELAEASDSTLPLTLSRVPSSFALVERVLDLNQQVEAMRAHTATLSSSNSLINSSQANYAPSDSDKDKDQTQQQQQQNNEFNNALVEQAVDDLQEQVHMLEKEVGMSQPAVPYGATDQRAPSVITALAVASKLQWFCQRMELIRERNVRFLKKEMDALEQTNRDMGEALQRLKQEHHQPVRPSTAALSGMSNDVNELRRQLHQADEAARSIKATSSKRIAELEEQLAQATTRLGDLERQSATEKDLLQKQLSVAQNQLASERERSQRDTEEHCEAMDRLQRDTERELSELRESAAEREVVAAQQNQRLAEMELALSQLAQELNDERYRRQVADRESQERLATANANLEHFQRLSETVAQASESSQTFIALQNELHEVKSLLERLQRQKKNQNSAYEAYPRLELELFQVRSEVQQSRVEAEKLKQHLIAMEQLKDEQMAQLRAQTQQGSPTSGDDIIREEMKHMKSAFELKLAHTKEEMARKSLEHSQQIRQLQEKFERDLQAASAKA